MDDEQAAKRSFSAGSYSPQANVMPELKMTAKRPPALA
jgi:hypothetical protein